MIFSSYKFIFCFFPLVYAVFCFLRMWKRTRLLKIWLVLASFVFYAIGQPDFFVIFLASVLFNYLLAYWMAKHSGHAKFCKFLMACSVIENIGLLVYFKYTNFILQNFNRIFDIDIPLLSLLLPIGISFFTFQILAFTVSVWRKEIPCPTLLDYLLFITFFPQLIVGPVVLHQEFLPQIQKNSLLQYDPCDIMRGILLFSIGAAKKVLLANPMIQYATAFYTSDISLTTSAQAWLAVVCFTFAYYFDFSGYIDMARGLGMLFGIRLPVNFNSPYKAENFADFWRRWNITISRFFDQTVFARIFRFGDGIPRLLLATFATFLVSGIWHGASWHFIIWGLVNGFLVAVSHLLTLYRIKIPKTLGCAVTFFVMMLVRVLFDANCMTDALAVYRKLFSFTGDISGLLTLCRENLSLLFVVALSAGICFFAKNSNVLCGGLDALDKPVIRIRHIVFAAILLVLSIVSMSSVSTFLYFSF